METIFLKLKVRSYKMIHGFDSDNREIEEIVTEEKWIDKLVMISRIQSISEKYVRMVYSHERIIYWEYEGGLEMLQKRLQSANLVINPD